jgi:5,6-dimethylbenzimidazole synthase
LICSLPGERKELYRRLKLEGILEAPLNIAVTCDRRRDAPFVLGRAPMPETDLFSTCLAVQNLWLAARAEGVGVGWVSILDREATAELLALPEGVELVAYLCVGYPVEFRPRPLLEEVGWKNRLSLNGLVYQDRWGQPASLLGPPP